MRLVAVGLLALLAGCGPSLAGVVAFHPADGPPAPGDRRVEMRYLGSGGWLIRRGADAIATAPFVSNPINAEIYLGPARPDTARIERLVPAMPDVRMILVGHTHYDHAMDLPEVLRRKAPNARLYGGTTLEHLFKKTLGEGRVVNMVRAPAAGEPAGPRWFAEPGVRVRAMALPSSHAPHVLGVLKVVSSARLDRDLEPLELPAVPAAWPEGDTVAFLIDFLEDDGRTVAFRIYYQDAAAHPGKGEIPPLPAAEQAPVDVAILCVAGFDQVKDNPRRILGNVKPQQVVGGHWEDFFSRSPDLPWRVARGTDLSKFVREVHRAAPVPVYVPEPGRALSFPLGAR